MKLRPLNDKILVLRIDEEEQTSGGIIIPDTAKEKPQEGKVVAVGTGKRDENGKRIPIAVKEGDRVGSARVVRIHESHVLLNTSGRTLTLHLFPESIKVGP